jgi:hypothetical protein
MSLPAWYHGSREEFLLASNITIANQLAGRAAEESLEIESFQSDEWRRSIDLLQRTLDKRIPILREVLQSDSGHWIRHVILEFDFRRRGLRMDCLLLGDGVIFVVEFKRSKIQAADRDQVITYAVNLLEFHSVTRFLTEKNEGVIVVPVLTLTDAKTKAPVTWPGLGGHSWSAMTRIPMECDAEGLGTVLRLGFENRLSNEVIPVLDWLKSPFSPSSSILDATLSLYGNHDVSAIKEHAAPRAQIEDSAKEIRELIVEVLERGEYHVVFLSGAPGAGKTLVGLDLVMRGTNAAHSVFVTGNAPLVEVLNEALRKSYKSQGHSGATWAQTGYHRKNAAIVASAANFKIVKAHNFLGKRGLAHRQRDGRILVFDEAQRTYEKGRTVLGEKLADHEANLILDVQKSDYPDGGAVVVALVGHNQAINRGERGILAWLEAVEEKGWSFSIADETLKLSEIKDADRWANHPKRLLLQNGHLKQSMRFYRNSKVEEWVGEVLGGSSVIASTLGEELESNGNTILVTRNLNLARRWAKARTLGNQRAGLIASGQARRLAAEGLFVDYKPDIATWMLAPSTDVRSSNALETVQNQFQVQGLELDHCIVCWDADLRREGTQWAAYKLSGDHWNKDNLLDVALNSYRVLLTRARKGMVIFVPTGDLTGNDVTRHVEFYDGVWRFLLECGARELVIDP